MLTIYDRYGAEHALEEHEVLGIAPTSNDQMTEVYTLDKMYYARESFMQFAIRLPMRAFKFDEEMRLVRRVPLALQKPILKRKGLGFWLRNVIKFLIVWFLLFNNNLLAQPGIIEKSINSNLLHREVNFSVFLPANYNAAKTYPVIFYLHAFGADRHAANGFTKQIGTLIDNQQFPETIIVAPDAGNSWYLDDYAGICRYASVFTKEFLPAIQQQFGISTSPDKRALIGTSMGGFGALRFAMLSPEQFGACVSLMGAIMTKNQARHDEYYDMYHKGLYGENLKGEQRINQYFIDNNPLYIIESRDAKLMAKTKWFIQCCDQDFHSLPNALLHLAMRERAIPHEYRVDSGDHTGECYNNALPEAIEFIRKAFTKGD